MSYCRYCKSSWCSCPSLYGPKSMHIIAIVFIILKAFDLIPWPWHWILLPIGIVYFLYFLLPIVVLLDLIFSKKD